MLLIYLLHHPDYQTNVARMFSTFLEGAGKTKLPKSLKNQSHVNTAWKKMIKSDFIIPIPKQKKMNAIKYQINPELLSLFVFEVAPRTSMRDYMLNKLLEMVPKNSYTPYKTIAHINILKKFEFATFLMYCEKIIQMVMPSTVRCTVLNPSSLSHTTAGILNIDNFLADDEMTITLFKEQYIQEQHDHQNDYSYLPIESYNDIKTVMQIMPPHNSRFDERRQVYHRVNVHNDEFDNMRRIINANHDIYMTYLRDQFYEIFGDFLESFRISIMKWFDYSMGFEEFDTTFSCRDTIYEQVDYRRRKS